MTAFLLVAAPMLTVGGMAYAAPSKNDPKVRICHATNSMTNPYVSIEVAQSAADGDGGNDKGQGDHYLTHTGPVWTPDASKKTGWGDIIPPIPGIHDGLNWTAQGQAIWSAGCQYDAVTDEDNDGLIDVVDPDADGDKVPDATDPDDDNDGTTDATDPDESTTVDTDGDTIPDSVDSDDNGDGLNDNAACDTEVKIEEPPLPPATDPTTPVADPAAPVDATTTTTGDKTNNAQTGVGQTDNGAGATRSLTVRAGDQCGTPVEQPEKPSDLDGDGTPDTSDKDDDGDGKPDATDPDQDGDTIPDSEDADDDGDSIPDVLDPDHTGETQNPDITDTDGDGTPDSADKDRDGDGVPDVTDKDVDGDGNPETLTQDVPKATVISSATPGEWVRVFNRTPKTNAGQTAVADVACTPAKQLRAIPMGGGSKDELANYACDVIPAANPRISLRSNQMTRVTIHLTAPAVGPYKALDRTITTVITPS